MEATLEPRLVMKGDPGQALHLEGEFFVAAYQRGYRWGRDEVRQLLDDIQAQRHGRREAPRRFRADYYLQPIVVLCRDDGTWELVDGQQRLTTLFLITKYISTKFEDAQVEYRLTYETAGGSRDVSRDTGSCAIATRTSTSSTSPRRTTRSRSGSTSGARQPAPARDRPAHGAHQVGLRDLVRGAARDEPERPVHPPQSRPHPAD